jgi:exo-1,4-beta-D-glucosaminidase
MQYGHTFFRLMILVILAGITFSCQVSQPEVYFKKNLTENWIVQSTDSVTGNGELISSNQFQPENWYPAVVPATVLHALVENGVYTDIYRDNRLEQIPEAPFKTSWWYRNEFFLEEIPRSLLLHFDGINYKANIWLNGKLIADTSLVKNAFRQFSFQITDYIHEGANILAVEVFPPRKGDFSIGFVDWNPAPPDNNMGLFRTVYLEANGGVEIAHPFIVSTLNEDVSKAALTASVEVSNHTQVEVFGELNMIFRNSELTQAVSLLPGETKKIIFSPDEFEELFIDHPELWWPHTLGEPHLYHASFEFLDSGLTLDKKDIDFGIREVSDYFTEDGHRGFKINGQKILIRGGGWVDRLLLDDTPESIENQLSYVKDMNLNTIRLEGFWGKDQTLYDLCDKMGILIMAGWSCHWEWEDYLGAPCSEEYGGILAPEDVDMMSKAWQDQVIWLRNHPSVFTWLTGSDCVPKPELEQKYFETFKNYDSTRIYLASAKEWDISLAGPTGVKMRGPYAYEPPVYWFADTLYGGAFGFNTETGPGAQVPPVESIRKMLSEQHLWPIDNLWNYHCGRHEFNTLDRYTKALEARYGKAKDLEDYTQKAQVLNYELMRPMFEAFSAYRYKATGVIQWMLNSAWPEMYWQLYDYYLMPNGAYYGAKKASQPYHVIYDYARHSLFVVNDKMTDKNNCSLKVRLYDNLSQIVFEKELPADLKANESLEIFSLPELTDNAPVYFLDLRLYDNNGKEIDNNFYWLSAKPDILDYDAEVPGWYYYTPSKQYADYTVLNNLPKVLVKGSMKKNNLNNVTEFTVTLTNDSDYIAFFVHPELRDEHSGTVMLPVLWSDNYVSLLPKETRVLTATIKNSDMENKTPQLTVEGYNLKGE